VISSKAFLLQILCRHHRSLHILVLPGTGSTVQVLICLSVREHWSSHWLLALEHSTLLYCVSIQAQSALRTPSGELSTQQGT